MMMLYLTDDLDQTSREALTTSQDISTPLVDTTSTASTSPRLYVHQVFATGNELCNSCNNIIMERSSLYLEGNPYHMACLRCSICCTELGMRNYDLNGEAEEPSCFMKDGLVMCKACYVLKYRRACDKCQIVLLPDDIVMRAKDSIYHMHCFTCSVCGGAMNPGDVFMMNAAKELFCQLHPPRHLTPIPQPTSVPPILGEASENIKLREMSEEHDDDSQTSNNRSKRMRTSFKHHQLKTMKVYFNLNHNPDAKDLKQLAQKTGLTKRVLQVWFQNARAKYRRSMQSREGQNHSPNMLTAMAPKLTSSLGSDNHSTTSSTRSSEMSTSPEYGSQSAN